MDYKTLQAKFHYLPKKEASEITKYINQQIGEQKKKWQEHNKIAEFVASKEVRDNYDWLLNPNCKNRDFNAGFQAAIEQIKAIINSDKDKGVEAPLNLF